MENIMSASGLDTLSSVSAFVASQSSDNQESTSDKVVRNMVFSSDQHACRYPFNAQASSSSSSSSLPISEVSILESLIPLKQKSSKLYPLKPGEICSITELFLEIHRLEKEYFKSRGQDEDDHNKLDRLHQLETEQAVFEELTSSAIRQFTRKYLYRVHELHLRMNKLKQTKIFHPGTLADKYSTAKKLKQTISNDCRLITKVMQSALGNNTVLFCRSFKWKGEKRIMAYLSNRTFVYITLQKHDTVARSSHSTSQKGKRQISNRKRQEQLVIKKRKTSQRSSSSANLQTSSQERKRRQKVQGVEQFDPKKRKLTSSFEDVVKKYNCKVHSTLQNIHSLQKQLYCPLYDQTRDIELPLLRLNQQMEWEYQAAMIQKGLQLYIYKGPELQERYMQLIEGKTIVNFTSLKEMRAEWSGNLDKNNLQLSSFYLSEQSD